MKLSGRPYLIASSLTIILGVSAQGEPYMNATRIECVREAQDHLFNDRFAAVDSIYTRHIEQYPRDPLGYVFCAGALFAHMSDTEENLHEKRFLSLLAATDSLTAMTIDTCDDLTAAWMFLFRGHARAYRSLWEARFGSTMSALRIGLTAIDEYEQGLQKAPRLYDLLAGTGSYRYWKSARAGVLRWVGLVSDEKEQGLAELCLAADSSLLHRDVARSALIWVRLDRHEYDSVKVLTEQFMARYPDGKTFRWPAAQAYYRQQQYAQAAEAYRYLRDLLAAAPGNYYNLIQCDYYLTKCYSWLEQPARAIYSAGQSNEYLDQIPETVYRRQTAKLNYLRRMAKR